MFSHGISPLVNGGSVQRAFFALVVVVAFVVVNANHSTESGKASVIHSDGVHGGHAKAPAWRADSFGDWIKRHVLDKVTSDGAEFEFFGLGLHGWYCVNVNGCACALLCARSHGARTVGAY